MFLWLSRLKPWLFGRYFGVKLTVKRVNFLSHITGFDRKHVSLLAIWSIDKNVGTVIYSSCCKHFPKNRQEKKDNPDLFLNEEKAKNWLLRACSLIRRRTGNNCFQSIVHTSTYIVYDVICCHLAFHSLFYSWQIFDHGKDHNEGHFGVSIYSKAAGKTDHYI